MIIAAIFILIAGYLLFIAIKLGLTERLPLALSRISLEDIPDRAARKYKDKVIFTCDTPVKWKVPAIASKYRNGTEWSAQRIQDTLGYLSALLGEYMEQGDRVAICKENHLDIHFFNQAIIRAGGTACPLNNKFESQYFQPYINHLDTRLLLTDSPTLSRILNEGGDIGNLQTIILTENRLDSDQKQQLVIKAFHNKEVSLLFLEDELERIANPVPGRKRSDDEILYLVHSSGTTGFPKAVMLKNGAQSHAVKGWLCYVQLARNFDKAFVAVPNNHQAVILTFNSSLLMGLPVHWYSHYDQFGFDAQAVLDILSKERYTGFFAFPVVYTKIKEVPVDTLGLNLMRFWASTADASHEVIQRHVVQKGNAFRSLGIPIQGAVYMDAQGSSEVGTPSVLRYITPFTRKFERRIGRPGSTPLGPQIRIRKANGTLAKKGETGKLEVKGKTVFAGYWNNQELTNISFTDGWFFTGDVARYADDGNIIQLDRLVDVIHTKHGEVYSLLIEEKIHKHPAVFDACVFGAFQKDETQVPAIAVALKPGLSISESDLLHELNSLLTSKEQLEHCMIMDWSQFPIGVTGKTLKRVFRDKSKDRLTLEKSLAVSRES